LSLGLAVRLDLAPACAGAFIFIPATTNGRDDPPVETC